MPESVRDRSDRVETFPLPEFSSDPRVLGELIKIRKGVGGFALITIILLVLILIYK